ncbi:MAG: hypothetical protein JWQ01_3067, partial [Massilia sp.]|nr:hypothetical protein [Massilia sp.]
MESGKFEQFIEHAGTLTRSQWAHLADLVGRSLLREKTTS